MSSECSGIFYCLWVFWGLGLLCSDYLTWLPRRPPVPPIRCCPVTVAPFWRLSEDGHSGCCVAERGSELDLGCSLWAFFPLRGTYLVWFRSGQVLKEKLRSGLSREEVSPREGLLSPAELVPWMQSYPPNRVACCLLASSLTNCLYSRNSKANAIPVPVGRGSFFTVLLGFGFLIFMIALEHSTLNTLPYSSTGY